MNTLKLQRPWVATTCTATLTAALTAAMSVTLLSACGGGDETPAAGVVTPPQPALTLVGTAATGAAIAGGTVTANCTVGSASGLTAADGSFTLTLDKGQVAPCLLRVAKAGPPAIELYGFAASAGHVNITTLTDTALTRALAASPADVFAGFDAARASAINNALPAAISYVQTQLAAGKLGNVPADLMTLSFVVGDNFDKLLDGVGAAFLGAGHSYADWIAQVKKGADLISIITPAVIAASDITVSPAILALPLTGRLAYLKTAADLAGFSGAHVFGRGFRSAIQTTSNLFPVFSAVAGCKLSIEGSEFVFSAGGQTTRVSMTPYVAVLNGVEFPGSYASVLPRNAYGNSITMTVVSAPDSAGKSNAVRMTIENGVVTDAGAVDGAADTNTSCGASTGGNLSTDRSLDALSLPTALVAALKTSAVAKGGLISQTSKAVTVADLAGFAAAVNFGNGTYTSFNSDFTVKDVTRVSDCKLDIAGGVMRLRSAQAGYDHSFAPGLVTYTYRVNTDDLSFLGRESTDLTAAKITVSIDERTSLPVLTSVEASDLFASKPGALSCPRG